MAVKLIASDLDGTLLRNDKSISEETGKVSLAKDGTLIADLKEETLKSILIKNVLTKRYGEEIPRKMHTLGKKRKKGSV